MKSCPSHMNSAAIGGFAVMEVTIMLSGGCDTQTSLPGSKPKLFFFVIPVASMGKWWEIDGDSMVV